jgi:hypothetical protein
MDETTIPEQTSTNVLSSEMTPKQQRTLSTLVHLFQNRRSDQIYIGTTALVG